MAAAVEYAVTHGYKLVDGAYCYANENEVGQGLKAAFDKGVKREDVFVVSKVWATYNTRVELGLDKSLKSLGLDYVDLFLVHWPLLMNPDGNDDRFPKLPNGERDIIRDYNHVDTWKQMEALLKTGKTRAIGVSNVSGRSEREREENSKRKPADRQQNSTASATSSSCCPTAPSSPPSTRSRTTQRCPSRRLSTCAARTASTSWPTARSAAPAARY